MTKFKKAKYWVAKKCEGDEIQAAEVSGYSFEAPTGMMFFIGKGDEQKWWHVTEPLTGLAMPGIAANRNAAVEKNNVSVSGNVTAYEKCATCLDEGAFDTQIANFKNALEKAGAQNSTQYRAIMQRMTGNKGQATATPKAGNKEPRDHWQAPADYRVADEVFLNRDGAAIKTSGYSFHAEHEGHNYFLFIINENNKWFVIDPLTGSGISDKYTTRKELLSMFPNSNKMAEYANYANSPHHRDAAAKFDKLCAKVA